MLYLQNLPKSLQAASLAMAAFMAFSQPLMATEELAEQQPNAQTLDLKFSSIQSKTYDQNLKVRGIKLGSKMYLGHAKVAGRNGFGFMVEEENFSWGVNHRGIAISKRF